MANTVASTPQRVQAKNNEEFRVQDLIAMCLNKWQWFVVSFIVCMGLATLYLLRTQSVYTRTMSVMIKQEGRRKGGISSDISTMADMGIFNSNSDVKNELKAIVSPSVITEVVRRLDMNTTYSKPGFFKNRVLYGSNLPLVARISGLADNDGCSFDIVVTDPKNFELRNVKHNGEELGTAYKGQFGKTIKLPFASLYVFTTNNVPVSSLIGNTVRVVHAGLVQSVERCQGRLGAALADKETSIINLSYVDASAQRAEDFLNTVVTVYNENWVKDKNQIAISTSKFIDERLSIIAGELENVDTDISSFKSSIQTPNLEAASAMYMRQANEMNVKAVELTNQLHMARYVRQFVAAPNNDQLLPSNSGINSPTIEKQIQDYNYKLLQRNSLAANSSASNPAVQEMDRQLGQMRATITVSVDNEINLLNQQIKGIQGTESRSQSQLSNNPVQSKHLLSAERQQKVKESLYLYLLQKREENELSQAFTAYNTRIISPPSGRLSPTAPVRRNVWLIALLAAIGIPVALIYLLETFNTKVRGRVDLEKLSLPFVAEIPLFKHKKGKKTDSMVVVKESGQDMMNEAFRVARTNLNFMLGSVENAKVIMNTSANPGSGKTFITANLATSLAIAGKRVAVVDFDLRRATMSKQVGNPSRGITSYLSNQTDDWREIVVKGQLHDNLDVVPVGAIPPNPAELLLSKRVETFMSELKESYEVILIDCPPVEIVADTQIIAKLADITMFIVRAKIMERDMLPHVEEMYAEHKFNNMAVMLNGTEVISTSRYGNQMYGYRYGYNYGYGSY